MPAAIFVISEQDIHRSGATNIPDLLRMVPGLEVAQINPSAWAISARGFNGEYSDKLLVLMDGRLMYTSIFSGVYWDMQGVPLELIARIEVIRGPGATVWGTNAVNGVINIITKGARDSQGGLAEVAGGTLEHGSGTVRYGGKIGSRGAYRLAANSFEAGHFTTPDGQSGQDDWHRFYAGFRADVDYPAKDSLTVEGNAVSGDEGEMVTTIVSIAPPLNATVAMRLHSSEWNALGRWKHVLSPRSETSLQIYFDRLNRGDRTYNLGINSYAIDFQHHFQWRRRQDLVWGLGYDFNSDSTTGSVRISVTPTALNTQKFSSFVQDEVAILPGQLSISLGTKFEHGYYNGFNWQPSARITWTPDDHDTLWAAISGAQRTADRADTDVRFNSAAIPGPENLPLLYSLFGNRGEKNEHLTATEAGFRKELSNRLSFDSTVFFNRYRDLESQEPGALRLEADPAPVHWLVPIDFANLLHGETHGMEMFANIKLSGRWTVSPGYSFLTMHIHRDEGGLDTLSGPHIQGGNPNQQAQLRSLVNLPGHWQWTTSAYFVGRLVNQQVPSYTRLDTNLGWQLSEKTSLNLVGQNLLKSLHQEYAGPDLTVLPSLIRRSAYARLTWRF